MTNREPYQKCSHSPYQTMVLIHTHTMGLELCVKKDLERFEQKKQREINTRVQTSEDII